MPWTYDVSKRQYISPGGKPLSHTSTVQLRNAFAKARGEIAKDIAKRFLAGELTPASFRVEFERFIGDTITAAFLLGRGGMNAALVEDATKIMNEIGRQLGFADEFLTEISDGALSDAEITDRIAKYADASVKAFEEGVATSHGLDLPGVPGDWATQCKAGCRCYWQIIDTGDTWECTWIAQSDGAVCDDCAERAANWSPYVIRK
jgi:hypothetical protein